MIGIFDDFGVHFEYPMDWELEVSNDGPRTTVSLQSPNGPAFAIVTLDEDRTPPAEVADEALTAMKEEYPTLDALPALDTIAGRRAVGHDLEFVSLDVPNSSVIRCCRTPRRTILFFGQWSELDPGDAEAQIQAVRNSLEETDS